ncbi:MAG: hypothetical protein A2066_12920 [Bacteroidetes bacterium GWB2_41_8]|nr:MAG: hypothetical protein A2066_12920 [Bacteroidetes bacterium GWB2_41_8]
MNHKAYEVVSGYKKQGYNPLTTAYNQNKVTTVFLLSKCYKSNKYKAVVGCKPFRKNFFILVFFSNFALS